MKIVMTQVTNSIAYELMFRRSVLRIGANQI